MKRKDQKRVGRSGKKINGRDKSYNIQNLNISDSESVEDKEYCLTNCVFNRKYNGDNEMIGCDYIN